MSYNKLRDYVLHARKQTRVTEVLNGTATPVLMRKWTHRPNVLRVLLFDTFATDDRMPVAVKYHDTIIAWFYNNGDVQINSGGWRTATTKGWLGEFGVRVWSEGGTWYVHHHDARYVFKDNMVLHADGTVSGAGTESDKVLEKKLRAQITQYAKKFSEAIADNKIEAPSAGDCFFCYMRVSESNVPLGEANQDTEHLLSHMKEKYFVPSLLWRALEVAPCANMITKQVIAGMFQGAKIEANAFYNTAAVETCRKAIRWYLLKQFGLSR